MKDIRSNPDRETMWQRTLRAFVNERVALRLRGRPEELVGRWTELGAWSGTFVPEGGKAGPLDYSGILSCESAPAP